LSPIESSYLIPPKFEKFVWRKAEKLGAANDIVQTATAQSSTGSRMPSSIITRTLLSMGFAASPTSK